jgi:sigma-54 dependent transcriptional regulator, acetoin dehydrogenase operon transcriptional activator AcoR
MGSVSDRAASLARAREAFLTSGDLGSDKVRQAILTSWRRSRFWGVDVDQIDLPYRDDIGDVDDNNRLIQAARPVLDRLEQELSGARMSVILTDAQAWVLDRRAGEPSLNSYLDKVLLAPGFTYAEKVIGTNGIGTALEERRASHVFGHEHFVERLQTLSCAGAPIRDPLSGKVLGLVDVTCWRADASLLMSVLVQEAARDIEGRLFEQSCERERALLQEFLAACRRTKRPILSLSEDLTISNIGAAHLLDHDDYAIVRERAIELAGAPRETIGEVLLSDGQVARLRCKPVLSSSGPAGTIVEIQVPDERGMPRRGAAAPRASLPGLAGQSPAWVRACQEVDGHCRTRSWLLLVGEPGVGKMALARAAQRRSFPDVPIAVVDAADCPGEGFDGWLGQVRERLGNPGSTLVLRHLDHLGLAAAGALASALEQAAGGDARPWVVGTLTTGTIVGKELDVLLRQFNASVTVPPLRHRIGDVRDLVPVLVQRHAPNGAVECSPEVMQTLLRRDWPGNVAELEQVLSAALERQRSGQIRLEDLPVDVHATSRRVLTTWESLERDAIAQALVKTRGNRTEAAARLGISRATIYRKIHAYGIEIEGQDR